jgi:hypothetical protein
MSCAKDNVICNSTYSWWAAWLNKNKTKKVYSPTHKEWFGPSYNNLDTKDLIPDNWIKIAQETLTEQSVDSTFDYYNNNPEIFENFDWKFLKQFLMKLRESSVENMMSVQPFLYSGREWIDRYFGEDQEDNEAFQEVLEMADRAKDKMIQGVLNYMESEGMEIELDKVNRLMKKFSVKILELYISFR